MTTSPSRSDSRSEMPQLPISGLVAVSTAMMSVLASCMFLVLAVSVLYFEVNFGDDSLAALALGSSLLFLGCISGIGLVAGVICTFSTKEKQGLVSLSLIVNCVLFLLMTGLLVVTVINS